MVPLPETSVDAAPTPDSGGSRQGYAELRVQIPRAWHDELTAAARSQAISLSDLVRIVLRGFLRERLSPDERERLERTA